MANEKYDYNAGVIGYDKDHQRLAGEITGNVNVDQQNFMKAHLQGDIDGTRASNQHAIGQRSKLGYAPYVSNVPEYLQEHGLPEGFYDKEGMQDINNEARYALTKYGEFADATAPYETGKDPELDAALEEMRKAYDMACDGGDWEGAGVAAGQMNKAMMSKGFAPMSYAEDIAKRLLPENATEDDYIKATNWQSMKEVDRTREAVADIKGLALDYDPNDPKYKEMDARITYWGDQYTIGSQFGQVDMMRTANDEANKIRLEYGIMPHISYGSIGNHTKEVSRVKAMGEDFAYAQDQQEVGKAFKDAEVPWDDKDFKQLMTAQREKEQGGLRAKKHESIVQDANKLTSGIQTDGTDLSFETPQGG